MSTFTRVTIFLGMLFVLMAISELDATEYPAPPKIPAKFNTPEEVQQYLGKLHNYYVMVGRPRFGKRSSSSSYDSDSMSETKQHHQDYLQILSQLQKTLTSEDENVDK